MLKPQSCPRRGAVVVEAAVAYPLLFVLLLGVVVGGLGVFRHQQVACQAREAARWACVRGAGYQKDTGTASPTQEQIRQAAVVPLAAGMDPANLSVTVEWVDQATGTAYPWDTAARKPTSTTASGAAVTNTVRVTVTYQWLPAGLSGKTVNLVSVSEIPMSN
jgi:Flp pilus assembly protein TadG